MYYTVYKITNLINNKIYIGVHKTNNLEDGYMGSGKYLKYSITKYGIENFKQEYIAIFDNADDMFNMESKIVNEEFVLDENTYNLKLGGNGGWDNVSTSESLKRGGKLGGLAIAKRLKEDTKFAEEFSLQMKKNAKKANIIRNLKIASGEINPKTFLGKTHTEETKKIIGLKNSVNTGSKNSQFGSMWITDGIVNKKIHRDQVIPDGWTKGRIFFK